MFSYAHDTRHEVSYRTADPIAAGSQPVSRDEAAKLPFLHTLAPRSRGAPSPLFRALIHGDWIRVVRLARQQLIFPNSSCHSNGLLT